MDGDTDDEIASNCEEITRGLVTSRTAAALAATALVVAAGGCGLGAGETDEGEASLRVTRDYGDELFAEATVEDPSSSETVIRFLDREADIETRFGGGFVQSIDGLEGGVEDGRSSDWFFYVDGIESSVGAAEVTVRAGDPGVVGPPGLDGRDARARGGRLVPGAARAGSALNRMSLECADAEEACAAAGERLAEADVEFENTDLGKGEGELRVLVGLWEDLREDETAALLEGGPGDKRRLRETGDARAAIAWALERFDETATPDDACWREAAWSPPSAPVRTPPVWVVTGMDGRASNATVAALEERRSATATRWR